MALSSDDLPTPLCPEKTVCRSASSCAQPVDAEPARGAGQQRRDAELAVQADERLVDRRVDEVGLVQAEDRRDAALLGAGEVAVDQVRLQVRLDQRHDDDDLIDVGDQDVLPPREAAGQHAVPRLDALDHAFVASWRAACTQTRSPVVTMLRSSVARSEHPAHGAAELPAVFGLDDAL